ncbi:hypothetical protein TBR22_A24690 [Luteitalea sp. TBR-22]|uniref:hypothetical protein n=1 Tax=Luteitalea sp. TBR-22 TaxID=2802971 RepID=UPI001AF5FFCF|nr:hypothetical protein [Luteitalea sp. TBR-22]BCS33242.1 hypothetical protein TBR22_A24690 [Luteitalea sp. TBR-22]
MIGSLMYGCVIGLGFFLATKVAPQPTGSVIWWSALTIQLGIGARLCWRRTGLPFVTAAMAIAAASCALLATLAAAGMVYPDLPAAWWPLIGASMVASPSLALVESRVNRAKWDRWRVSSQRCSLWDILRGRHIPNLRQASEVAARR